MKRKIKPVPGGTFPDWLIEFRPDDWPGRTVWQQWENYDAAAQQWQEAHPHVPMPEWQGDVPWNPADDPP